MLTEPLSEWTPELISSLLEKRIVRFGKVNKRSIAEALISEQDWSSNVAMATGMRRSSPI
jgi:hypothetical protein